MKYSNALLFSLIFGGGLLAPLIAKTFAEKDWSFERLVYATSADRENRNDRVSLPLHTDPIQTAPADQTGALANEVIVTGELRTWHRIGLDFTGPSTSETATPNPFSDYALSVTFTHLAEGASYTVPGFFAADGNAAETSAEAGDQWRVYFAPDRPGTWTYSVSFTAGPDVATAGGGSSAGFMDGLTGSFTVEPTDKTGRDHRGKGRLQYVGEHYLQYAGTGEWFVKAGADAPENTLAYEDFDAVPDTENDWTALITPLDCVEGIACDDGDPCTIGDVLDAACNCSGTPAPDSDADGICDAEDQCPGADDTQDADGDGIPDACDDCDGNLAGTPCDDGNPQTGPDLLNADCECIGEPILTTVDNYWLSPTATGAFPG
jgi:hypothetical protein